MAVDRNLGNINSFHTDGGNEFKNQQIEETLDIFDITRFLRQLSGRVEESDF